MAFTLALWATMTLTLTGLMNINERGVKMIPRHCRLNSDGSKGGAPGVCFFKR